VSIEDLRHRAEDARVGHVIDTVVEARRVRIMKLSLLDFTADPLVDT
jgi:hypothetical protein